MQICYLYNEIIYYIYTHISRWYVNSVSGWGSLEESHFHQWDHRGGRSAASSTKPFKAHRPIPWP